MSGQHRDLSTHHHAPLIDANALDCYQRLKDATDELKAHKIELILNNESVTLPEPSSVSYQEESTLDEFFDFCQTGIKYLLGVPSCFSAEKSMAPASYNELPLRYKLRNQAFFTYLRAILTPSMPQTSTLYAYSTDPLVSSLDLIHAYLLIEKEQNLALEKLNAQLRNLLMQQTTWSTYILEQVRPLFASLVQHETIQSQLDALTAQYLAVRTTLEEAKSNLPEHLKTTDSQDDLAQQYKQLKTLITDYGDASLSAYFLTYLTDPREENLLYFYQSAVKRSYQDRNGLADARLSSITATLQNLYPSMTDKLDHILQEKKLLASLEVCLTADDDSSATARQLFSELHQDYSAFLTIKSDENLAKLYKTLMNNKEPSAQKAMLILLSKLTALYPESMKTLIGPLLPLNKKIQSAFLNQYCDLHLDSPIYLPLLQFITCPNILTMRRLEISMAEGHGQRYFTDPILEQAIEELVSLTLSTTEPTSVFDKSSHFKFFASGTVTSPRQTQVIGTLESSNCTA